MPSRVVLEAVAELTIREAWSPQARAAAAKARRLHQPPAEIARLDRGAEHVGILPSGENVWHAVVSPPSGIERDIAYAHHPKTGKVRKATDEDYDHMVHIR